MTTILVSGDIYALRKNFLIWFSDNQIKLNADKYPLLINPQEQDVLKIGIFKVEDSYFVVLNLTLN